MGVQFAVIRVIRWYGCRFATAISSGTNLKKAVALSSIARVSPIVRSRPVLRKRQVAGLLPAVLLMRAGSYPARRRRIGVAVVVTVVRSGSRSLWIVAVQRMSRRLRHLGVRLKTATFNVVICANPSTPPIAALSAMVLIKNRWVWANAC